MVKDSQPTKRKRKPSIEKKEISALELTFSYAYDCLRESIALQQFLGFTLSLEYVPVHKSRSEELSKLLDYFPTEVLRAVVVWSVQQQGEPVIRWTDREAMDAYLKANGVT